jgi:hypothetical protein
VRFHIANHNINASLPQPVTLDQHGVRFADPGGRSKIDLQLPASLSLNKMQEVFRALSVMNWRLFLHGYLRKA